MTSHYSSRFCGYNRIFCSLQDLESSGLVGSAALLVDLSVEMHFFIWARLPSVQVSPHHRRSTSPEAFGTPPGTFRIPLYWLDSSIPYFYYSRRHLFSTAL